MKMDSEVRTAAKLDMMVRGAGVKRFHTARTLTENNVAEHSFEVALLCHILSDGTESRNLLLAALTHDLAEHETGDIPGYVGSAMKSCLKEHEEHLLNIAGLSFALTEGEERTLKLADRLSGMLFCLRERQLGNRSERIARAYEGWFRDVVARKADMTETETFVLDWINAQWFALRDR